ncbi:hypothetical protein AQ619_16430 [Caulobacter henricii]|uniref:Uncharacterized protein n=1 Tax=Caulobacter henricii TaxID=69395 RepID=A0A0P0P2N3_9CAUL|nr:hypothetical protein AQ619_16430 [Caulobacter henricii]
MDALQIAVGLGVAALLFFAGFAWSNAFASGLARGLFIVVSALAIALFSAIGPSFLVRSRTAVLSSLVWWLLLVLIGSAVTLTKSGDFDEGGPAGLALVLGFYLGLPIALLATIIAGLLGRLLNDKH